MTLFVPRTFPQIVGDMIASIIANSPITDTAVGSVARTLVEAAAQEDDEQYFQMLNIVRAFSLDTTTGTDLDARGYEYGVVRNQPTSASTQVTLGDSAFSKVFTNVYPGKNGPLAGSNSINGVSSVGFLAAGNIIVGRGTSHSETVTYTSITQQVGYVTFNLSGTFANDHGTNETIILAQGGNRVFNVGITVMVPASDVTPQVAFTLNASATLLDGENLLAGVLVTTTSSGSSGNVPVGAIKAFTSPPFATATVTNPFRVTNGQDLETDSAYRDRIKSVIQSLSRGTGFSIQSGLTGLISASDSKRVVSVKLVEPTITPDIVKAYIDDGTGFTPTITNIGVEIVVGSANGGETFLNSINTPIAKAYVESGAAQTFALYGNETLIVSVGSSQEIVTFAVTDFSKPGFATAIEVQNRLNTAQTFESRISSTGSKVRIFARGSTNESIIVSGGTANAVLAFPTARVYTAYLYKLSGNALKLLSKDGVTASVESGNPSIYNFGGGIVYNLCVIVDEKIGNPQQIFIVAANFLVPSAATAAEVIAVINAQLSGALAQISSINKVSIVSNQKNASVSGIQVLDTFDQAWNTEGGVLVDRTAAFKTNSSNVTLFATNGYIVYFGMFLTKFSSVWVNLSTPASVSIAPTFQYWNGSAWTALGVTDGTAGFTQSGYLFFSPPPDMAITTVQGVDGYYIRVTRTASSLPTPPIESRIKISSANEVLGYPTVAVVGADSDYQLNRFIGQIQLTSPLVSGDQLTLGSFLTRGFIISGVAQPYNLNGGETVTLVIDGVSASGSFQAGDFAVPGTATAQEVANALMNRIFSNITCDVVPGNFVRIKTNTFGLNGSIQWNSGTATGILNFPSTTAISLQSHVPFVESTIAPPYVFLAGQIVALIIDGNAGTPYSLPCSFASSVTSGTSNTTFADTTLQSTFLNASDLVGFDVLFTSGALNGQRKNVSSYTPLTGTLVVGSAFTGTPAPADTYVLLPTTNKNVVIFWNNRRITQLNSVAEISLSSYAAGPTNKVQIASLSAGNGAGVHVLGGSGNAIIGFSIQIFAGISGYRYWQGLLQLAQWTVDGVPSDQTDFPGIRAAGVQVEIIEPVVTKVIVAVTIVPSSGVTTASISNDIASAISAYVNGLGVGESVLVSSLISAIKAVVGVQDLLLTNPTSNIAVASNALARVQFTDITVQ